MANYPEELERLSFSAQQKEILKRRLLAGASAAARPRPRRDRRPAGAYRALIAAVAAVSLLIGAAGAVSLMGASPAFRALCGAATPEEEQNLGALAVGQVFRDKNGSGAFLTVQEIVSDQERLYVLMDFTAPEGTVLPAPDGSGRDKKGYWLSDGGDGALSSSFYRDEACALAAPPYGGWSYGFDSLADPDPGDNVIPLLFTVSTDRGFPEEAGYCRISGISALSTAVDGAVTQVLEGMDLEVVVPLRGSAPVYSFYGRCGVKLGGSTMAVAEHLTISPISISLDLIIPDSAAYDAAFAARGPWPVYVLLSDGSRVSARFPDQPFGRLDRFYGEDGALICRVDHAVLTLEKPIDVGEIVDIVFVGDNDPHDDDTPGRTVHFLFSPNYFSNNAYWDGVSKTWGTDNEEPGA